MAKRVQITVIVPPAGIYAKSAIACKGWAPSSKSRFAAVKIGDGAKWWSLQHVASGGGMNSLLPTHRLALNDVLRVCEALDAATHVDWREFDALPVATMESREPPQFVIPPPRGTVDELRRIANAALGV